MKILLVEDDEQTVAVLTESLTAHHYLVNTTNNGQTALEFAKAYDYDLIVLDIMIPGLDGMSLCRQLRLQGYRMAILMLTAKDSTSDRVMGLEAGADDYVIKPFDLSELLARIQALLRRPKETFQEILSWENLKLNLNTSEVTYNENSIHLTPKEYGLLELFLRNPGRIFSRFSILDRVWPLGEFPGEKAVNTQIKGLRQKLKAAGMNKNLIESLYGLGYQLKPASNQKTTPGEQEAKLSATEEPALSLVDMEVMADIAKSWLSFKEKLSEQFELFEQIITHLSTGTMDRELWQQAETNAHRLIGSLGTFGLSQGSDIARKIEQLLQSEIVSNRSAALQLTEWVELLRQIVERRKKDQEAREVPLSNASPLPASASLARLLVISVDSVLTEKIKMAALSYGLQIEEATNLTAVKEAITRKLPDVILLDLLFSASTEDGLRLLAELASQNPSLPVLVMTEENQLTERVAVARLGGRACFQKPVSSEQLLKAVIQSLNPAQSVNARVMIVDDDPQILKKLVTLLEPLGLHVTTLDDPRKFWDVLEAASPDLLILDIKMPNFSGLELCQVVRNDSHWRELPILFLSALTDEAMIQQSFAVGVDDYVRKPVVNAELIARVLNWLKRFQIQNREFSAPEGITHCTEG
jgi:DNA-binding response OmpR family regulator/HPt (histidine-containing phosphotransfer) domain-containing protein